MTEVVTFQSDVKKLVFVKNNEIFTDSLTVAKAFDKQHKNVLRDIEVLDCSEEFNRLNFEPVTYRDLKGELRPKHNMTRNGFTFLAMGYKGEKAARFKEAYIAAFDIMESQIKTARSRSMDILTDNYEFTRRQLRDAKAENKRMQDKLLSAIPYWAKIKQCKDLDLSHAETGRVIGKSTRFVSATLKKMAALGIKPESVAFRRMLLESELARERRDTAAFKRMFPDQYKQIEDARLAALEGGAQ